MSDTPVILPDDPAALKAMIAHLQAENARIAAENMRVQADIGSISATLRAHEALVQALQIQIARLKKQKSGASSERIKREIEQLELALEHLEIAGAAAISAIAPDDDAELSADEQAVMPSSPLRRKPLVADGTPRESIVLDPGDDCPHCGGTLRLVGEDVSEMLELISARLKLTLTARLKKSCRRCERITQLPAASRPIPREPWLARACWHMSSCRSSTTTFRFIARTRSLPGWAPTSRLRPWLIGAVRGCGC